MKQKQITIRDDQEEFLQKHTLVLSKIVQRCLDKLMKQYGEMSEEE
jgi:hypothetical protein